MVQLIVSYLEMTAAPAGKPRPAPAPEISIAAEKPEIDAYLDLYRAIGEPVQWDGRLKMPKPELAHWLSRDSSWIHILRDSGKPVGLCEFDASGFPDVELAHFGLLPEAQGRGLGGFLLDSALRSCWAADPKRVWLHTDTNDHPNARDVYRRAGFRLYAERLETFAD